MAQASPRPLSPHLQIYRWTWTMAMSVFHRGTGAALYGGTLLLAVWLLALAGGPRSFAFAQGFFGSWLGLLILIGYTWALMHHMMGGVRHLVWDTGAGFDPVSRKNMARLSLLASLGLTGVIWAVVLGMR